MVNIINTLNGLAVLTNEVGDKVEQKQARALKSELMDGFVKSLREANVEVMYDNNANPLAVLDNGLIIGFDFSIKKLNTELHALPPKKASK